MGLQINTNVAALNAYRNLNSTQGSMQTSLERLSSGLRINRAADDAAGLAISEKLRAQVSGLNQASANAQDGVSLIQTAEGALNETHSILQRMRTLAVQAASDTNTTEDRGQIQKEIDALTEEIDGIATRTQFNGMNLLDGTYSGKLQIGANSAQTMDVGIADMRAGALSLSGGPTDTTASAGSRGNVTVTDSSPAASKALAGGTYTLTADKVLGPDGVTQVGEWSGATATIAGVTFALADGSDWAEDDTFRVTPGSDGGSLNLKNQPDAEAAIEALDTAINTVSGQRANLGAIQNRLDHTINNLGVSAENLAASESRIRDTDMAKEMTNFTRSQILQQAGTAMLAQANQSTQGVLRLLG